MKNEKKLNKVGMCAIFLQLNDFIPYIQYQGECGHIEGHFYNTINVDYLTYNIKGSVATLRAMSNTINVDYLTYNIKESVATLRAMSNTINVDYLTIQYQGECGHIEGHV